MADDFIGGLGSQTPTGIGGANTNTTADQLRNQVLSQIATTLATIFPNASAAISPTATAGAATLPAAPVAFLEITVGSIAYKIALYGI